MLVILYAAHKSTLRHQNNSFPGRRTKELCIDHREFLVDGRNYTFTTYIIRLFRSNELVLFCYITLQPFAKIMTLARNFDE